MKTKTINLYSFDELSKEAQEKAHSQWVEQNDCTFLSDYMAEWLHELLQENGITDQNDTSKPGTTPTPVFYSLSHNQGDGAMFEGDFEWKGCNVNIKQSGHYFHSNSKIIEITRNADDDESTEASDATYAEFDAIYKSICKELERRGYEEIEYQASLENFTEACEANEWTFTSDGIMEN